MLVIFVTLLWFTCIVAVVNWLQIARGYSYGSHWYLHLPIIAVGVTGLFLFFPPALTLYDNNIGFVIGGLATIFFYQSLGAKPSPSGDPFKMVE